MTKTVYCSFCGKAEAEVFYIVEGPANAGICDECVVLATDLIQRQRGSVARSEPKPCLDGPMKIRYCKATLLGALFFEFLNMQCGYTAGSWYRL